MLKMNMALLLFSTVGILNFQLLFLINTELPIELEKLMQFTLFHIE
jgi:hypothetical protein